MSPFSLTAVQHECLAEAARGNLFFARNEWRGRGRTPKRFQAQTTAKLMKLRLAMPRAINDGLGLALVATDDGRDLLSQLARMGA